MDIFIKGVITPFRKALLRLLEMHYYAFKKGVIKPFHFSLLRLSKRRYYALIFMHKWRNSAFSKGVVNAFFQRNYDI